MEELYLQIINHLSEGVYYVDTDRTIRFWNHGAEEITGYRADEIVGKTCQTSGLNHIDTDGTPLCTSLCPLYHTICDGEPRTHQVLVRHKSGYRIPVKVSTFPVYDRGTVAGAVEIFSHQGPEVYGDNFISGLTQCAIYDPLTALPNRRYMESVLDYKIQQCSRFGQHFAVLFADIDDYRMFNNTYGHEAGDAVLKNISASISGSIRSGDMVARWGGEEFLGVYTVNQPEHAAEAAEIFRALVQGTDVTVGGRTLSATCSVGVTLLRPDDTLESAVHRADQLM